MPDSEEQAFSRDDLGNKNQPCKLVGFYFIHILTEGLVRGTEYEDMFYVYVLFSDVDRMLYVGYSANLKQRFKDHCAGRANATRNRRPLRLIYYEAYLTRYEAERREKYLKGGNGRAQLKLQLSATLAGLNYRFIKAPVIR